MNVIRTLERRNGFTLLELLLAIFIFAIVVSAVYGAYLTTLTIINETESYTDVSSKARMTLDRIAKDLESVYLGEGGSFRGQKQEFGDNRADTLQFTSTAHLIFTKKEQPAGFATIKYTVEQDSDSKLLQLYRTDIPFRPGNMEQILAEEKGFLLCDELRAIHFVYYDHDGTEVDDWQSEAGTEQGSQAAKKIPAMIEIQLLFLDSIEGKGDLLFKTAVAMPIIKRAGSR